MKLIILTLFASWSVSAAGEWWTLPRTEDDTYYYYVGTSEGEGKFTSLQEEAFGKAMSELIREHFGMSIQVSESAVEELNNESFQVITKQSSAPLFIKGVTMNKTYEKDLETGKRLYVQVRVDRKTLAESIENHLAHPGEEDLNKYGDNHASKIDIKVKTSPAGALITFTHLDQRYSLQGQGNALFYLPRGRYQMVVSAPGHMAVSREINLIAQGREEKIILDQLHTKLDLAVHPSDAVIELNGKRMDTQSFKLPVGKSYKFKFSHPDYLTQELEIISHYPERMNRSVELEPKMSTLYYEVQPHGARIEINGKEVSAYQGKIHVHPGHKKVRISHNGFFDHTEDVYVNPNRDHPLKVIYLREDSESISPSDKRFTGRIEYNPLSLHGDYGRFDFIPFSFHLEYYYISLGGGVNYTSFEDEKTNDAGIVEKETKTYSDSYATLRLISPRLGPFKFFASATVGKSNQSVKKYEELEAKEVNKRYHGTGGGMRIYLNPKWSLQAEYFKVATEYKELGLKKSEARVLMGASYEF